MSFVKSVGGMVTERHAKGGWSKKRNNLNQLETFFEETSLLPKKFTMGNIFTLC